MATTLESMMGALYATPVSSSGSGKVGSNGMSIDDFYKILATQMKYQDADNPMDTSEMMAQMVQTQMIEAITQMTQTNTITYASSMVGKEVAMAEIDEQGKFTGDVTKGTITGMLMGDSPILFIGDKGYYMSQIMTIGKVPEKNEDDETQKPGDTENGGNTGGEENGTTKTV